MKDAPDCSKCIHNKGIVPGDSHHIRCEMFGKANVVGNAHGIENGWFFWPVNFDPIWLESCDSFSDGKKEEESSEVNLHEEF